MDKKITEGVSVIIPVYNTALYLERCISSILENTYQQFEIICVNDGSTDESLEILKSYAANDKRIKIIDKPLNEGVSMARNSGLESASKEWIAFIDSDDWIHPNYLEFLVNVGKEKEASVVICKHRVVLEESKEYADYKLDETMADAICITAEMLFYSDYKRQVWGKLYKNESIKELKFAPGVDLGEDRIFNIEIICRLHKERFVLINNELYNYFQREGSAVHSIPLKSLRLMIEKYISFFEEGNKEQLYQKIFVLEALKLLLSYRYIFMFDNDYSEIRKYCRERILLCWKYMKTLNNISIKEYFKYGIMINFPPIYRIFRIATDKTMLKWEREQKKNRKLKTK